ncbi:MAG TPA: L-histidine N(alpha)-methyltransferase [Verrucomicrobiae bacterium]|nr:L-histidine N(alpha)-methyltransferase [Verrucomicrobiae bacterium]
MEHPVAVTIHPSCFPERTRAAYLESFRTRRMNHRFHYESEKQAQQWLAIHEAYSPARTDDDCLQTYDRALSEIAAKITSDNVALISIGCGGGQKDFTLLKYLRAKKITYIPTDVSLPLALTAHINLECGVQRRSHFSSTAPNQPTTPSTSIVSKPALLDLPATPDLSTFLDTLSPPNAQRIIAFFGMLPNFEPNEALPILASALHPGDLLIASANLAPGDDYRQGVQKILPLYDNAPTRRWLSTALTDAGLQISPADLQFTIADVNNLLRIEAHYQFNTSQTIHLDTEQFTYTPNQTFRLFYSYRHTRDLLRALFAKYGLGITGEWITASREEGIFLSQKS